MSGELPDSCPLAPSLTSLDMRVTTLETTMAGVKSDTEVIRAAIVGVTSVGTFFKKHGKGMVGFVVGSLFFSGFISLDTFHRLKFALAYLVTQGN